MNRALVVARATNHRLQHAQVISNLADAYIVLKDRVRARELIDTCAGMARQHGFARLVDYAFLDEARLLRAEGRQAEAIAIVESAAHCTAAAPSPDICLSTDQALVQLHKECSEFELALLAMQRARQRQALATGAPRTPNWRRA